MERVRPDQEVNAVATEQVGALLSRLEAGGTVPLFVFDAGYDPVKLQQGLEGSACQILVRLRAGRRFYGDPSLCDPPAHVGRPRRHGPKMKCSDPGTWPEPSAEHACEDAGYGSVRVRAWAKMHPKEGSESRGAGQPRATAHRGRHARAGGGRAPAPRREAPRAPRAVAMVARAGGEGAGPRSSLALLRQALRPGAHLPLSQAGHGVDDTQSAQPRASRPVDVAGIGRVHAA